MSATHRTFGSIRRRISSRLLRDPTPPVMERHRDTDDRRRRARDDEAGLRGELGQTLALFGMALAVVLVGVLAGIGL